VFAFAGAAGGLATLVAILGGRHLAPPTRPTRAHRTQRLALSTNLVSFPAVMIEDCAAPWSRRGAPPTSS
jgi:hypothetical protein